MVTINELPSEILDVILPLTNIYLVSSSAGREDSSDTVDGQVEEYEPPWVAVRDYPPLHCFPFNVANVCTLWRDILSKYPEYWTNLHIIVDAIKPTPLSEVALYLQYSRELPLKIIVTRTFRSPTCERHPEDENRVRLAIEVLGPHFPRCTTISFDLRRGSLLPSFSKDLAVRSPTLSYLSLRCEVDDGHPPIDLGDMSLSNQDNNYEPGPMRGITISGFTIMEAIKYAPSLFQNAGTVITITLSTYKIMNCDRAETERTINAFFGALKIPDDDARIIIDNIDFPYVGEGLYNCQTVNPAAELYLCNLTADMFQNVMSLVDFENSNNLTVNNCSLERECALPFPSDVNLSLINIKCDLSLSLSGWSIGILDITNCPGFNDEVIRMLAKRRNTGHCFLKCLEIANCTNFSVAAIRELAASQYIDRGINTMTYISIGPAAPPISVVEREELEKDFPDVIEWGSTSDSEDSDLETSDET